MGYTWITVVVLLGCLCGLGRAQDPEITENILPDIRRLGTTGHLNCTVINQMHNSVYWTHKATSLTISKDDKIEIEDEHNMLDNGRLKYQVFKYQEGERFTYKLMVNSLERRDHGLYTCQIHVIGATHHPTKDGTIVVLRPPSVLPSRTTHTVSVRVGDPLNLTCDAEGYPNPNITWVRVSGDLLPTNELRHTNKTLYIESVQTEDRGIYRCLADNAVRPPSVNDATVLVFFQPIAKFIQSSYGQAVNRMFDLTIECRIAGWPEPDLQWYQVGDNGAWTRIDEDHKHAILILLNHANILESQERWFQMIIRTVTANDFGDYVCQGRNAYGSHYATINVFETSECQGPNCPNESPDRSGAQLSVTSSFSVLFISLVLTLLKK